MTRVTRPPNEPSWREQRRRRAWALHRKGWTQQDIADALGVTPGAVSQWMKTGREHGWQGLRPRRRTGQGQRVSLSQQRALRRMLAQGAESFGFENGRWTAPRVREVIRRELGVQYHPDHVRKILRRLGNSFQKIQRVATKHDDALIQAWLREKWPQIRQRAQDEERTLVFLDESGFYLAPLPFYSWSPRGHPLRVRGKLKGKHLSVIGALTWEGRLLLNVHRQSCHKHEVVLFLRHLLFVLPGKLLLLWDHGSIHQGQELEELLKLDTEGRLAIEAFPSYAPEINPQEYVWRHLKYDDLLNRTTYSIDTLAAHLANAADRLRRRADVLRGFISHAGLEDG